ncbi:MAG: discoidin domain-containing protein [Phycisphaerales bacterium]|jgi:hypothetical protein|nr:discoidin domain-containing protein [Phycisphaerales bacterium]
MMNRLAVVVLLTLIPRAFCAQATPTNIALHKPYTFNIEPNDSCTDPGDKTQLTDGVIVEKGVVWEDPRCVGWNFIHKPVSITIDLGSDQPISGISFRSAATGAYGFPTSLAIAVSTDGQAFHVVGDLVRLEESWLLKDGTYAAHTYRTTALSTHGRYVRVTGVSSGLILFCDEIEVYKGEDAWLKKPITGPILTDEQLADPLRLTQLGVFRRVASDWTEVRNAVEKDAPVAAKKRLLEELDAIKPLIQSDVYPKTLANFKAILPIGPLDEKVHAIYGKLLAANGTARLTVWHTPPYQLLEGLPAPMPGGIELNVRMMGNEHRAEVFNLTNASEEARTVQFVITGLPADAGLSVYQVEMVDNRVGWPTHSALVSMKSTNGHYTTVVPAGMTRQIWLSFHSDKIAAGQYAGRIMLSSGSFERFIPLRLDVADVRMSDDMALNSGMWDYIYLKSYGVNDSNQEAAARDLTNNRLNMVWGTSNQTPFPHGGDFDPQGNLTGKIDYSHWDDFVKFWRQRNPIVRHFAVSCGMSPGSDFAGLKYQSPEYERAIGQWAADWARHNQEIGLKPLQALIVFMDEPAMSRFQGCYDISKAFKSVTKDVGILTNPLILNTQEFQAALPMMELADVILPTLGKYAATPELPAMYQKLRQQGKELGFYQCTTPVLHFDASYYRLQPWRCFEAGATFSGYWAYGDNGGLADSWNPYTAIGYSNYTPVFLSPSGVSGSKHWEALREGIEDYQYLYMLSQKKGQAAAEGLARRMTEQLLKEDPGYAWHPTNSSRMAEAARLEVLTELANDK